MREEHFLHKKPRYSEVRVITTNEARNSEVRLYLLNLENSKYLEILYLTW